VNPDYRNRSEPWDDPAIVRAGSHFDVVERLLAAGADPAGGDLPYRWTALLPAAAAADPDMVRRLLDLGVDPHVRGERGNALSLAACSVPRTVHPTPERMQRIDAVARMLLAEGVDPNVPSDSRTPLRCAEESGSAELAAALVAAGGRSHEALWARVKRNVGAAALAIAVILGGGM
jgi:ankyrin repeat protein